MITLYHLGKMTGLNSAMTCAAPSASPKTRNVPNKTFTLGYPVEFISTNVVDGALVMMVERKLLLPIKLPAIDQ